MLLLSAPTRLPSPCTYLLYLHPVPTPCTYLLYIPSVLTTCTYLLYLPPVPSPCTYLLYLPPLPTSSTYLLYLPPVPTSCPCFNSFLCRRSTSTATTWCSTTSFTTYTRSRQSNSHFYYIQFVVKKIIQTFRLKSQLFCFSRQLSSKHWRRYSLPRICTGQVFIIIQWTSSKYLT